MPKKIERGFNAMGEAKRRAPFGLAADYNGMRCLMERRHDPIGASPGIRRIGAGRVKLHRVALSESAVRRAVDAQRLFDAIDEQLQQRRIDTTRQPRGDEIRLRYAVPPG